MQRKIIITSDGSKTIHLPEWNEQYHSKHGAVQEAKHVFIKNGLHALDKDEIRLLEIGFGTGLNAFITFLETQNSKKKIYYTGIENFPVSMEEISKLDHLSMFEENHFKEAYQKLHTSEWGKEVKISKNFILNKRADLFENLKYQSEFDLIYFDAFGPRVQPELWTEKIFESMFHSLKNGGILATYCAKGSVRRTMQSIGFEVKRLPGPPGKKEMLRATKTKQ